MDAEVECLTDYEMDCITRVFRSFETGLRQATILPKVLIYYKSGSLNIKDGSFFR